MKTIEIPVESISKIIYKLVANISAEINDYEFDLFIIKELLKQWGNSPSSGIIAKTLRELADELDP